MNPLEKTIYICPICKKQISYLNKSLHFSDFHTDLIVDLYKTKTIKQISKQFNCTSEPIRKILHLQKQIEHIQDNKDHVQLIFDLHIKQKKTITDISKSLGFDIKTVKDFMLKNNIPVTIYQNEIQKGIRDNPENIQHICELYKTKSISEISDIYKCSYDCVYNFMRRNNIIRRERVEATSIAKRYYCRPYTLPSGKTINIQSKNEIKLLDYVFSNHTFKETDFDFTYKGHSFIYFVDGIKKHYFPDFYLPTHNLFIEVKSEWVLKRQGGASIQELKQKAVVDSGFKYILILDNDFTVLKQSN